MNRVEEAIQRSAETFRDTVWPHLAESLGGGELIPVETVTDSGFARLLDMLGMTDAWQVVNNRGMRGLSTRVQWTQRPYRTWTVRSQLNSGRATEFHKLMQPGDWQLPHYIVQAYVHPITLECLAAAAIRTADLQTMLRNGWHEREKENPRDRNLFIPVSWLTAHIYGLEVIEIP